MLHPTLKLCSLFALAVAVQRLHGTALLALALALSGLLIFFRARCFTYMLLRVRWLLLFLLLIFSFNTPGQYVQPWPFELAPSYEGVAAGLQQLGRLAIMLAAIALLLASSSRADLMAGMLVLLMPLHRLGAEPQRIAARLWLTLHYAETEAAPGSRRNFFTVLTDMQREQPAQTVHTIQLRLPAWGWQDSALALLLILTVAYLL